MSKQKSQTRLLREQMENQEAFMVSTEAVDPFVSLSTYVILTSEILEAAHKGDRDAIKQVQDYMELIRQEASNVAVDCTMRGVRG